jgi:hypothetical protein
MLCVSPYTPSAQAASPLPIIRLHALAAAAGPPTVTKTKLKAPVPSKDDAPNLGLTSNKNFITSNAVDVILAKPGKLPQPEFQWTQKPDYGKVPLYLKRNKQRIAKEKEHFSEYLRMREAPVRELLGGLGTGGRGAQHGLQEQRRNQTTCRQGIVLHASRMQTCMCSVGQSPASRVRVCVRRRGQAANATVSQLASDDRQQLIRHLKTKWGSVNTAYQVRRGHGLGF